ncbi:MAG: hypothetical protein F6K03_15805, partial [Kamptonema sp. SIO4C4]|nr:hypothetical protein [Kamptonema sp. SIO4C4]
MNKSQLEYHPVPVDDELPEDVSVELIDMRTIYPMDEDTIVESVMKTGRCVIAP